ncbi:hypothetical protein JOD24_001986 [Kroppenstedtia sanguinis]|uniref:Uncharacterized protein n=1 Tax=Kroppenstedtia sanguinis TaxID=1380684 RepID=A0ABW4C8V8_9BACL
MSKKSPPVSFPMETGGLFDTQMEKMMSSFWDKGHPENNPWRREEVW